ncbi:cupin [Paractinoplanes rishiriensis]|uniref:Cupin n=1 Tax=Paractinoplanes rishiriensis TaxID=1050105 RepID=A0A919N156_9ACTN|nr:cupin [Actinoplanes rishiriensis]
MGRLCGAGVVAGALVVGPGVASAQATPPDPGVVSTLVWKKKVWGNDLTLRRIRMPAGTSTGWHYHRGPVAAKVVKGTLSHFDSSCKSDGVYAAGGTLLEQWGSNNVHIGRNLGSGELVLEVLYAQPSGSPLAVDAPDPGCAFGNPGAATQPGTARPS